MRLKKENTDLKTELSKYKSVEFSEKNKLKGLRVLVIGDTGRMQYYREIVESYGGIFDFADGVEEVSSIKLKSMRADVIFHIVAYSKHNVTEIITKVPVPIVFVNRSGNASLEEAIKNFKREQLEFKIS